MSKSFFQKKKVFFSNFLFMRLVFPQSDCSLFQVRLMFCFVFFKKKGSFFPKEFSFLFKGFFFFSKDFLLQGLFSSVFFFQTFFFKFFCSPYFFNIFLPVFFFQIFLLQSFFTK